MNKIENETLLSSIQRKKWEERVRYYEKLLRERQTSLGRAIGSNGGITECFVKNDRLDQNELHKNLMHAKQVLNKGTIGKISTIDKNRLLQEKKRIEEILRNTLPSLSDSNSSDKAKTDELAHYYLEHQKKYGHLMRKLQNINRALEPDNPVAGNLRYLYKK